MVRLMLAAFVAVCLAGNADASDQAEQLGAKEFKRAEFYRRTGRPGSAAFYYQMVARRYPGTGFAEEAKWRLLELQK